MMSRGYKPAVIICSDNLNEIKMPEFIDKSKKLSPYSTRIVLTSDTEKAEIKNLISSKQVTIAISKDAKGAEFQQFVRLAFDIYHHQYFRLLYKKESKEKSELIDQLKKEKNELFPQSVQAIRGLINLKERYYFNNHINHVSLIVKSIAEHLDTNFAEIKDMVLSSILFNSIVNSMPQEFIVNDPYHLANDNLKVKYFELFNVGVNLISSIEMFRKHARVISQIWERADGTGLPNGIPGEQLPRAPQIISLANYYHNMVYRVHADQLKQLKEKGELRIDKETILFRHDKAIKTLYKNPKWYDYEIIKVFHDIIKKKTCIALKPESNPDVLKYFDIDSQQRMYDDYEPDAVKVDNADSTDNEEIKGSDNFGKVDLTKGKKKETEIDIEVENLEPGMIVAQNVVTKKGILIVRQDTRLDNNTTKNIKQLAASGMLSNLISIAVDDDN
jgi:response regulator RpfG family c-di-GMP phosphodiesterase